MILYDPEQAMPTGLPRPVWEAPDGRRRPVPWSQASDRWGVLDVEDGRGAAASDGSLCLVCGLHVSDGYVLISEPEVSSIGDFERPQVYTRSYLGLDVIADYAPLHGTCVKITRAHCRTIRDRIASGSVTIAPYRDEV